MTGRRPQEPAGQRDAVKARCEGLPGAELTFPFGEETAVYKVGGKMFALVSLDGEPGSVTLKCDPDEAISLREAHRAISPGYYMNKRHWVTIALGGDVPLELELDLVTDSYALVVASLPARARPAT
jgi:predicted DNA-binding protein (MmcQ/YjbR family)